MTKSKKSGPFAWSLTNNVLESKKDFFTFSQVLSEQGWAFAVSSLSVVMPDELGMTIFHMNCLGLIFLSSKTCFRQLIEANCVAPTLWRSLVCLTSTAVQMLMRSNFWSVWCLPPPLGIAAAFPLSDICFPLFLWYKWSHIMSVQNFSLKWNPVQGVPHLHPVTKAPLAPLHPACWISTETKRVLLAQELHFDWCLIRQT